MRGEAGMWKGRICALLQADRGALSRSAVLPHHPVPVGYLLVIQVFTPPKLIKLLLLRPHRRALFFCSLD